MAATQRKWQLIDESLIDFKAISFLKPPATDWVFFYSPKCVAFFFAKTQLPEATKIATMGPGTAATLKKYCKRIDFVGNGKSVATAAAFTKALGDQSVLFPHGKYSRRSVQKLLPTTCKVHDLVIYQNEMRTDFEVPKCDYLLFTSSQNVNAYYQKYAPDDNQFVIAIGDPTGVTLAENGVINYKVAPQTAEQSMLETLEKWLLEIPEDNKNKLSS